MDATVSTSQATRRADPRTPSLRTVAAAHWRQRSPWVLGAVSLAALAARLAVGGWSATDALVATAQVALFPLVEWVVHTSLLHLRPRTLGRLTIDPLVSRKHREHHADPRDVDLIFIPLPTLALTVAVTVAVAVLAFPRIGLGLTFLAVQGLLGSIYEWVHHLVHTDYRPRTRVYRAIWRSHRLHHYKNEHYWFTVTTAGTFDRLLRTYPDPSAIPTSPTARSLHSDVLGTGPTRA